MKKLLLFLVFLLLLLNCEGVAGELVKSINADINRCNEYSVLYHLTNSNNCDNPNPTEVYVTSEEYQRLYNIVSNESPQECIFVNITPKDGSQIRIGYVKDLTSFVKNSSGPNCN